MTDTELVITEVQGWMPDTRLYRVGSTHWLITAINVEKMVDAISLAAGEDLGEAPPSGHVAIYRADYTETPMYQWVPVDDLPEQLPAGTPEHVIDGDTLTVLVDGDLVATYHREQYDVAREVVAIDTDGDPLNGLTPQWVLPHGTTWDQAIDHIKQMTTDSEI